MFTLQHRLEKSLWEGNANRIAQQINHAVFRGGFARDAAERIEQELFEIRRRRGNNSPLDSVSFFFSWKNKKYHLMGGKIHSDHRNLWDLFDLTNEDLAIEHNDLIYVDTVTMLRLLRKL